MTPTQSINDLCAECCDLRAKLRVTDGIVLALVDEHDALLKELAFKDSCILALNDTVLELQAAMKRMAG